MTGACGPDHCVTCSDEAQPMLVLAVDPTALARCVDERGTVSEVMVDLVGDVGAGDLVLVHAGVAIAAPPRDRRQVAPGRAHPGEAA